MGKIGILPKSAVIAIAGALFASILAAQEPLAIKCAVSLSRWD